MKKVDHFYCVTSKLRKLKCKSCNFNTQLLTHLRNHSHKPNVQTKPVIVCKCKKCHFSTYSKLLCLKHILRCKCKRKFPRPEIKHELIIKAHHEETESEIDPLVDYNQLLCEPEHNDPIEQSNVNFNLMHQRNTPFDLLSSGLPLQKERFHCDHCPYKTSRLYNFKRHVITNHSLRTFECEVCNMKFENKRLQTQHIFLEHATTSEKVPWLQCEYCSFKTVYKTSLKHHHLRKHTHSEDITWYQCEDCSYRAKRDSDLKEHHLRIHADPANVEWFQCELCPYKAKKRWRLQGHERRRHSKKEKTKYSLDIGSWLRCGQCEFQTTHKNSMNRHKRVHAGTDFVNWYCCQQCSYRTKWKTNLKTHVERMHQEQSNESCVLDVRIKEDNVIM